MPGRTEVHAGSTLRVEHRLWLIATAWLLLNALSQWLVSGTADRDQAEQLLLSQSWQLGYGPQPPLYTYLVKLSFLVTGPALGTLMVLKVALLSLLVAALLGIGRELAFSPRQQVIALSGLTLIPQIVWESQRDLTHTVLATSMAALTLLQLLRLQRQPAPAGYAALGLLAAAGLLSKYNYGLFLTSLVISALSLRPFRRVLLRPPLILTLGILTMLIAPHLAWVLGNGPLALGAIEKLELANGIESRLAGLLSAAGAALAFLTPLWLAAVMLFWRRPSPQAPSRPGTPSRLLLLRLPLVLGGVMLAVVLTTGASKIKDRWYQPLLFYAPVSLAALAGKGDRRRERAMVVGAITAAGLTSLLLPARTALAGLTGRPSSRNAPLPELLRQLDQGGQQQPDLIAASSSLLAGNARLVFPTVPVLTPKAPKEGAGRPPLPVGSEPRVLVLIDQDDDPAVTLAMLTGLRSLSLEPGQLRTRSLPLRWVPQKRYTIRYAWLRPADRAGDGRLGHLAARRDPPTASTSAGMMERSSR